MTSLSVNTAIGFVAPRVDLVFLGIIRCKEHSLYHSYLFTPLHVRCHPSRRPSPGKRIEKSRRYEAFVNGDPVCEVTCRLCQMTHAGRMIALGRGMATTDQVFLRRSTFH
jgi:hypothetical protein